MVYNQPVSDLEADEPLTESEWADADPHVDFEHGDVVKGDRVEVEFVDPDGTRRVVEGEPVRFDATSGFTGAKSGHNVLIRTDDEWVQSHDPDGDLLRVNTRRGGNESVVEVNRPGAGLNETVASTTANDDIIVRPAHDTEPCAWCGDDVRTDSLKRSPDGGRCAECLRDPDPEHADPDFDVRDIRHVVDDHAPAIHLVTTDEEDVALCGQLTAGLRPFGDDVDTVEEAAKLGAWVNGKDDMCDDCREAFHDAVIND